eukprot:5713962-Amphidinium_carterae.1
MFEPAARPKNEKPEYPSFRQSCSEAPMIEPERRIIDDWLPVCWRTRSHIHGFYNFTEHKEYLGWTGNKTQRDKDNYWRLKHRQQRSFQKIELQTSMRYYRKMNPGNDVFKML